MRKSYSTHGPSAQVPPTRGSQGSEHWLAAYRRGVEINSKNLKKRVIEDGKKRKTNEKTRGLTLNKDLLLQLHCAKDPLELSSVNIVDQKINSVNPVDLSFFSNVIEIDASVNLLSLDHFSGFESLRELNLSLNRLKALAFDATDFPHLQILDLSFNSLSGDAIAAIGRLSRLRVLHLTDNELHHLPVSLTPSRHDTTQTASGSDTSFKKLEILMLDDNKLSSDVFSSLANLQSLKYLNLSRNVISEVPLELLDRLKTLQAPNDQGGAHRGTYEDTKENLLNLMQFIQQQDWGDRKEVGFPFPALQSLNLSSNKISEEEVLLTVALFPKLSEIDISSNPLTTQRNGDPPLLTHYLQDKLGVKIKRKEEKEVKALARVCVLPKWKARKRLTKRAQLRDPQTHVDAQDVVTAQILEPRPEQPLFVTEIEEDFELEFQPFKPSTGSACGTSATIVEPIEIQTAVRMLEHTLGNLNVYRDSKPKLDSIQTPYAEKEKRIKALPPRPAPPLQQQREQFDRMMEKIKLSRTMVEVPLTDAIKGADANKRDYKEGMSLLNDLEVKYKTAHRKTMEQALSLGSDPEPTNSTTQE